MAEGQTEGAAALIPGLSSQDDHLAFPSCSPTILLVEDEEALLEIMSLFLMTLEFNVITASSGQEAIAKFLQHRDSINLLLTDIVMPEMDGFELAQTLSKIEPELKIIFMSGYSAGVFPGNMIEHFVQKPFTRDALAKKIAEVMTAEPRARATH